MYIDKLYIVIEYWNHNCGFCNFPKKVFLLLIYTCPAPCTVNHWVWILQNRRAKIQYQSSLSYFDRCARNLSPTDHSPWYTPHLSIGKPRQLPVFNKNNDNNNNNKINDNKNNNNYNNNNNKIIIIIIIIIIKIIIIK